MKILVVAAMLEEIIGLEGRLESRDDSRVKGASFLQGNMAGHEVYVVQTGIGLVNAAMMTALSLERFNPNYTINIGVAGGLDSRLRVGDVVIGEEMVYNNVDAQALGYDYGQVPGELPTRFQADEKLLALVSSLKMEKGEMQTLRGLIVSGDEFMHTREQVSMLMSHWPEVCSVDMETTAMAHVCYRSSVPFLSIRVISDMATDVPKNKETYENFMPVAANRAISLFTKMLGHL